MSGISNATGITQTNGSSASGDMLKSVYDPANISEQLVGLTAIQTLTNKTLTAPVINTPNITAGTAAALTSFGLRSTGAAFDLKLASSEVLTATRTLSVILGDTARTLTMAGNASISGTNTGDQTNISGNAGTATALQNARNIGGVSFDGTADIIPTTIASINEATDTTCFPLFITAAGSQSLQPKNNASLTFNSNTGALGATSFSGAGTGLTGTAASLTSGNVTTNANLTGPITSSGNATAIASQTGTGTKFAMDTNPVLVGPTLGAASATSLSFSSTSGIIGTITNNDAAAGSVGQYIESKSAVAANFPTTNQFGDVGSISLTAGDWDVTLIIESTANGSVVSTWLAGISITTGNSATGLVAGENEVFILPPSSSSDMTAVVPSYRMSLSGTTIVYGKILGTYITATPQYKYRLSARRMR